MDAVRIMTGIGQKYLINVKWSSILIIELDFSLYWTEKKELGLLLRFMSANLGFYEILGIGNIRKKSH